MQKLLPSTRGATRWSLWSVCQPLNGPLSPGGDLWSDRLLLLLPPRIRSGPELQRHQRGVSGQRIRGARQQRGHAMWGQAVKIQILKYWIILEVTADSPLAPAGQRALGGSAPVNIPGSLARSSSFNSSSSLSTSPLSSLSQSLSQSLLSAAVSQQHQQSSAMAKQELGLRGTPTSSSQNSLGVLLLLLWPFAGAQGRISLI